MLANQRMIADDGYEVALFPCEAMYLTTARDPAEHDVYALDFLPRNTEGEAISPMNCYAPFSGTIVYTGSDHNCILQSDDKVHLPDGSLSLARILVAHSEVAPILNYHYTQGQLFYTTGNYGISGGEHLHIEGAKIDTPIDQYWNTGGVGLYKGTHLWDILYKNNTEILRDGGFDWIDYEGGSSTGVRHSKFPWVLYSRRLRERR